VSVSRDVRFDENLMFYATENEREIFRSLQFQWSNNMSQAKLK
jgi:hypothetical protein